MQNSHTEESPSTQTCDPVDGANRQPSRRKLSMSLMNFWLDLALLVNLVFVGWVSATMRVVFPAPTSADGWTL